MTSTAANAGDSAQSSPARKRPALSAAGFWHCRRSEKSERRGICVGSDMAAPGREKVPGHPPPIKSRRVEEAGSLPYAIRLDCYARVSRPSGSRDLTAEFDAE